jgi:hypothetical protein
MRVAQSTHHAHRLSWKEITMKCMPILTGFVVLLTASAPGFGQDPGWPRKHVQPEGTLISYQPQVDEWKDHTTITWREAFEFTPTGGKKVIGAGKLSGMTNVDHDKHLVVIYGIQVINTYFPDLDQASSAKMDHLVRSFVPPVVNISLERVVAYLPKPETINTVNLKNDPPFVFVNYSPAILLAVDGEPLLTAIPNTKLKFVVNTQWAVFFGYQQITILPAGRSALANCAGPTWPMVRCDNATEGHGETPQGSPMGRFEESDSAAPAIQRSNSKGVL